MSIDDHELCDDSSLRATKTVAWQRLKQALCFSLGYSITLWKSFSHICWIRAILLEIFIKKIETSLSYETMTTASDLHHFRVQTPSFLISSSSGDLPVEVWAPQNFIENILIYSYYLLQLSNLQQQRIMVEQLRREAAIKRVNVSQAIEDIKVNQKMFSDENQFYYCIHFLLSFTEIHLGSWIRRLPSSRISISKVQSLQGKIIL